MSLSSILNRGEYIKPLYCKIISHGSRAKTKPVLVMAKPSEKLGQFNHTKYDKSSEHKSYSIFSYFTYLQSYRSIIIVNVILFILFFEQLVAEVQNLPTLNLSIVNLIFRTVTVFVIVDIQTIFYK
jgi:type III secretory pathway component EscU